MYVVARRGRTLESRLRIQISVGCHQLLWWYFYSFGTLFGFVKIPDPINAFFCDKKSRRSHSITELPPLLTVNAKRGKLMGCPSAEWVRIGTRFICWWQPWDAVQKRGGEEQSKPLGQLHPALDQASLCHTIHTTQPHIWICTYTSDYTTGNG